jgi:hypothetical protein
MHHITAPYVAADREPKRGRDCVAPGSGFTGKRQVAVMAFQRIGGSVSVRR